MFGDLHCHTVFSDGSMNLEEIISYSKRIGLDCIAITDHNTIAGNIRASVLGNRYGVTVMPGVEISCYDYKRKRKVHLLCYLPLIPDRLEGFCNKICLENNKTATQMIKKVIKLFPVTQEHIAKYYSKSMSIYKQHIMNALMDLGYTDRIYGDLFHELFDSKNGSCYLEPTYPDVYEALQIVNNAKGIAVFAHPSTYDSFDLVEELCEKNLLHGIETWHPRNSKQDTNYCIELSDKYNLIKTGGTDFHGFYSNPNPLVSCITPDTEVEKLFKLSKKLKKGLE